MFVGDAYQSDAEIPYSLSDALDLFEESKDLHSVLGEDFSRVYSIVKRTENDEFLQVISPWEREHLLLNV
jgi:glutamine synthetase